MAGAVIAVVVAVVVAIVMVVVMVVMVVVVVAIVVVVVVVVVGVVVVVVVAFYLRLRVKGKNGPKLMRTDWVGRVWGAHPLSLVQRPTLPQMPHQPTKELK